MKALIITLMACAGAGSLALADGPAEGMWGTTGVTSEYLLYEYPKVESDVSMGGLRLTVDKAKWAVGSTATGSSLGHITGDGVNVRVSQAPAPATVGASGPQILAEYPVSCHGVHGTKIVYGTQPNIFFRHITGIQYYFTNREGQTICFDARAGTAHPDWAAVNDLMLNNLHYAKS